MRRNLFCTREKGPFDGDVEGVREEEMAHAWKRRPDVLVREFTQQCPNTELLVYVDDIAIWASSTGDLQGRFPEGAGSPGLHSHAHGIVGNYPGEKANLTIPRTCHDTQSTLQRSLGPGERTRAKTSWRMTLSLRTCFKAR